MEMKEKVRVVKFGSTYALEEYDEGIWKIMRDECAPPISKGEAVRLCKAMNVAHSIFEVMGLDRMTLQEMERIAKADQFEIWQQAILINYRHTNAEWPWPRVLSGKKKITAEMIERLRTICV